MILMVFTYARAILELVATVLVILACVKYLKNG